MMILLIEDEPHVRNALARTLVAWGYQVETAETARDALASIQTSRFDLLILDINLPDAPGWDVVRALPPTPCATTPVIVISAVPPNVSRLREFRPFGMLYKPFPIEALHRLVTSVESGEPAIAFSSPSD